MGLDDFEKELAAEQAKGSSSRKRERSRSRDRRHRHSSSKVHPLHLANVDQKLMIGCSTVAVDTISTITPRDDTTVIDTKIATAALTTSISDRGRTTPGMKTTPHQKTKRYPDVSARTISSALRLTRKKRKTNGLRRRVSHPHQTTMI